MVGSPTATEYRRAKNGLYLRLYNLFRLFQQANRFVTKDLGTSLGITESFLLIELDSVRERTAQDLCYLLKVDKSVVSRNLHALMSRGYVKAVRSDQDRRSNMLEVTPKGKKFLERYDELSNEVMLSHLSLLSRDEQDKLVAIFRHYADNTDAGPGLLREKDLPFRVEVRRMTRVLGMLKKTFMDSPLNTAQWQVLAELDESNGKISYVEIAKKLTAPASSISTIVGILESKGCVARASRGRGRHPNEISVTKKGSDVLRGIEETYCAHIANALAGLPDSDLHALEDLLQNYLGLSGVVAREGSREIRLIETEQERKRARAFLVENLILFRKHLDLPDIIMAEDSWCWAMYDDQNVLQAVAETRKNAEGAILVNYAAAPRELDLAQQKSFLEKVFGLTRSRNGSEEIRVPPGSLAQEVLQQ